MRYIRYILTVIKHGWQITEHAVSEHLFMGTSSNWEDFASLSSPGALALFCTMDVNDPFLHDVQIPHASPTM